MVKITRLDDVFLEHFELQASRLESQSLQQKEKKRGRKKGEKRILNLKILISTHARDKKVVKHDAIGRKGKQSCWKRLFY